MSIWQQHTDIGAANAMMRNTIGETLGITVDEIGDDYLRASMPVDARTHQPMGILHGGASVVLAESVGSMASNMVCANGKAAVGLDVNANHLCKVRTGRVHATARPVHLGRTTHVWDIRLCDDHGKEVCISRLTMAVIDFEL